MLDGCGGFELDPIDGIVFVGRFAVPYYNFEINQTSLPKMIEAAIQVWLTSIDFTTNDHLCSTYTGLDDGAVLGIVIDNLILAVLDGFAGCCGPCIGYQG